MGEVVNFPRMGQSVANFTAMFHGMKIDKAGNLVLTFLVPIDAKYDALPITDFPGMVLRIDASRQRMTYSKAIMDEMQKLGIVPIEEDVIHLVDLYDDDVHDVRETTDEFQGDSGGT